MRAEAAVVELKDLAPKQSRPAIVLYHLKDAFHLGTRFHVLAALQQPSLLASLPSIVQGSLSILVTSIDGHSSTHRTLDWSLFAPETTSHQTHRIL